MRLPFAVASLVAVLAGAAGAAPPDWTPAAWTDENTVELRTTDPGDEPHWFPVWVVTIDGQLYVRLGSRAAGRFDRNLTKPVVGVRIAGRTFERVRGVIASDRVAPVAAAMKDKYWLQGDFVIRHMDHPYTIRLEPEPADEPGAGDAAQTP
jgi:hypothetical protein